MIDGYDPVNDSQHKRDDHPSCSSSLRLKRITEKYRQDLP